MLAFTDLTAHIPFIVLYEMLPFWSFLITGEDGQDLCARDGKFLGSDFLKPRPNILNADTSFSL